MNKHIPTAVLFKVVQIYPSGRITATTENPSDTIKHYTHQITKTRETNSFYQKSKDSAWEFSSLTTLAKKTIIHRA